MRPRLPERRELRLRDPAPATIAYRDLVVRAGRLIAGEPKDAVAGRRRSPRRTRSPTGPTPATTAATATSSVPRTAVPTSRSPASSSPSAPSSPTRPGPASSPPRQEDGSLAARGRWSGREVELLVAPRRLGRLLGRRRRAAVRLRRGRRALRERASSRSPLPKATSYPSGHYHALRALVTGLFAPGAVSWVTATSRRRPHWRSEMTTTASTTSPRDRLYGKSLLLTDDYSADELHALLVRRRAVRGARPRREEDAASPARAGLRALLRQLHPDQVGVGGRGGAARDAAGHRGRLVHAGLARRDRGRDRRDARDERARARRAARPDPRRGERLHARREEGDRRLPRGDGRPARSVPGRQPPVRHRPPDADARRPLLAAREVPGRPRRARRSPSRGRTRRATRSRSRCRRGSSCS